MVYYNCACQKTCTNPTSCFKNCADGEEACICPDGFMLDGDANCVIENNCNCFVNEFGVIPDGGSYVTSDCSQTCSCNNNRLNCEILSCSADATCQPVEGSHQCQCKEGFIGNGLICTRPTTVPPVTISDCFDLYNAGIRLDGVYTIYPAGWSSSGFQVYCDMTTDGGGWTVFQRRRDGTLNFYQGWNSYKSGFGGLSGEHWLGNDKIHALTQQRDYQLRVDLVNSRGSSYHVLYTRFGISNENDKYRLVSLGTPSGTAGCF
ncbi:Fibrinogen C domain-containing protein 1 [Holothuria leucospilota]|uniref:Fibrinogen C domain-containing protein 1 n=1 Tax=Holothuria leucospilota TaxID=206669 RepID=A0A9Q0YA84_HOLLE|nr:Fibrinogen C domain-containing protein 1 [Holothuria leucospilota]